MAWFKHVQQCRSCLIPPPKSRDGMPRGYRGHWFCVRHSPLLLLSCNRRQSNDVSPVKCQSHQKQTWGAFNFKNILQVSKLEQTYGNTLGEFLENSKTVEFPKCEPHNRKILEIPGEKFKRTEILGDKFSKIWVYLERFYSFPEIFRQILIHLLLIISGNSNRNFWSTINRPWTRVSHLTILTISL